MSASQQIRVIPLADMRHLPLLCGPHHAFLQQIENQTGSRIETRQDGLEVSGGADAVSWAGQALTVLIDRLERGQTVEMGDVDGALRVARPGVAKADTQPEKPVGGITLSLPKRTIAARSPAQQHYLQSLKDKELVFGVGPAGTGKTYLAVAYAAMLYMRKDVERIVLSRPAVEAGERIGFLPGDMKEKVDPYLRPLYDALYDVMHADMVDKRIASGEIEIAPLAFMRGRTLSRAVVILDEAQNATVPQMKMFLTRLGEGSRMVVTGDPTQTDLPSGVTSGLGDVLGLVGDFEDVGVAKFTAADVVRHRLVAKIVTAYEARDAKIARKTS